MYRTRSKEKEKWDDNRLHSPLGRGSGRGRRLLAVPPLRRLPRPGNGLLGTLQCILLVLEELDVHPLARRVIVPCRPLDAVTVILVALVMGRMVLGLRHRDRRETPAHHPCTKQEQDGGAV